jgi:hypothetical protein
MEVAQKDKGHAPRELNLQQHKIIYFYQPPGLDGSRLLQAWWRKNRLFKLNTSWQGGLKAGGKAYVHCSCQTGALFWPPRMPPWTASVHFCNKYPLLYRRLSSQFQFSLSSVVLDMYLNDTDVLLIYLLWTLHAWSRVQTGQPNIFQRERLLPRKA